MSDDTTGATGHRIPFSGRDLIAVVPISIALISLIFSLYTWWESQQGPTLEAVTPDIARLVQSNDEGWVYFQPSYIAAGNSDQAIVIKGMKLEITPDGDSEPTHFRWDEEGTWAYDAENNSLHWVFAADPHPIVVSAGTPQSPVGLFIGETPLRWQAMTYTGELVTQVENEEIRTSFSFTVTPEMASAMTSDTGLFDVPVSGSHSD